LLPSFGLLARFLLETLMKHSHRWAQAALVAAFAGVLGSVAAAPSGWVTAASSADARADYARGFSDGVNGRDARERDSDYRAGHRAGRAKRESNESRPEGRDYARGYVDGFNEFRERKAVPSKNRAYVAGYRAGQADHTNLVAGAPTTLPPVTAATSVDTLVGRPSSRLDQDMKQLGFERMGQFKQGKEAFTTWQSKGQGRCVRVLSKDGKVHQVTNLEAERCV
jgi:hypothetical protein